MEKQIKLNLGCFNKKIHGFINVDIRPEVNPDVVADITTMEPFGNNYADLIYSSHTLEHFPRSKVPEILRLWWKILKPNGLLRLAVPNIAECMKHYVYYGDLKVLWTTLGGSQKHPFDFHLSHFDEPTLTEILLECGYKDVKWWDWRSVDHYYVDDYSQAYLPEGKRTYKNGKPDIEGGRLFSLNLECIKA